MEDDKVLSEIYEVVKSGNDGDYDAVIEARASYPYLYHLASARANLVDWLPITSSMRVLERNAECGALTLKLLEKAGEVVAVTKNDACKKIIEERCREDGKQCGDNVSVSRRDRGNLETLTDLEFARQYMSNDKTVTCSTNNANILPVAEANYDVRKLDSKETPNTLNIGKFNIIMMAGDVYRFRDELPYYRELLRPNGMLVLADANRLGLKYFAGCQEEYGGGYFAGVEGYVCENPIDNSSANMAKSNDGLRTQASRAASDEKTSVFASVVPRAYTRREYRDMLVGAGFAEMEFYYPYPDYKFPNCIYSDAYLPQAGELADNRRNFDRDRYRLFDEKRVFDTIVAEGLFGEFANSFLIVAHAVNTAYEESCVSRHICPSDCMASAAVMGGTWMENDMRPTSKQQSSLADAPCTVYVKYSDERDARFRIRTDIEQREDGSREVFKYAMRPEGEAHIAHIADAYVKLAETYKGSGLKFCKCDVAERCECVRSEYVCGETLQQVMERAAGCGDMDTVWKIVDEYVRRVREFGGSRDFARTADFTEAFGEADVSPDAQCADVSDIDMIFSNIFARADDIATQTDTAHDCDAVESISDGKGAGSFCTSGLYGWSADSAWTVIDYEWTFDFPVPKDFVIYRAIYFAFYQILTYTGTSLAEMLSRAGISGRDARTYAAMEAHFQAYIGKGSLPLRAMQRKMGTRIFHLPGELGLPEGETGVNAFPYSDGGKMAEHSKNPGSQVGDCDVRGNRRALAMPPNGRARNDNGHIHVRKILYHIDRVEYQDGSMICGGWALAKTAGGGAFPVDIEVTDEAGGVFAAEVTRRFREDVAPVLNIRHADNPNWGFDCVWYADAETNFTIRFSLGGHEKNFVYVP